MATNTNNAQLPCDWTKIMKFLYSVSTVVCNKYGIQKADRENIIQDTALVLVKNMAQNNEYLNMLDNWEAYLFRIIQNMALSHLRRMSRGRKHEKSLQEPFSSSEDLSVCLECFLPDNAASPEDTIITQEQLSMIKHYLQDPGNLDPTEQQVFSLYILQYSYDEIASVTGINSKTVGVWIYRIKKKLIKLITQH